MRRPTMTAYKPTVRDMVARQALNLFGDTYANRNLARNFFGSSGLGSTGEMSVADFTPAGVGFAADEAGRQAGQGHPWAAAGNLALAALPAPAVVKGGKKVAGKALRALAHDLPLADGMSAALDMSKAARMARAAEQGFTTPAYHETSAEAADAIKRNGFDIPAGAARRGDGQMPDAVFTKPTDAAIGVGGKNGVQLPVMARQGNMARELDRNSLESWFNLDPKWKSLSSAEKKIDETYGAAFKSLEDEAFGLSKGRAAKNDRYYEIEAEMDNLVKEWQDATYGAATQSRKRATDFLREGGYSSLNVVRDQGGLFGNRSVNTTAFLNPGDVRMADDAFHPGGEARIGLPRPGDFRAPNLFRQPGQ